MKTNNAINKNDMDLNIKPGENFYLYSNGNWIKNHPVPADKPLYGSFTELYDDNQTKLKNLIDSISKSNNKQGSNAQKIADLYNSGMDTSQIEKDGINPIIDDLNNIDKLKNKNQIIEYVAKLHKQSIFPLFYFGDAQDDKNSSNVIGVIYQGGLGLPDRDYYFANDSRIENIRTKYKNYIKNIFILTNTPQKEAAKNAETIFNIEKQLAEISFTRLELRNPFNNYNKIDLDSIKKLSTDIDWELYFKTIGLENTSEINVSQIKFVKGLSGIIKKNTLNDWKIYLKWNIINSAAPYLTKAFEQEQFNFYGKILSGQKQMQARWKRILSTVDNALGEAIGKLYVEKYFPPASKKRMQELVQNLKKSFKNRIENLDWMTNTTKQKAIEKLNAITVKVGYPDKWKDYSNLEINKTNGYFNNIRNARIFSFNESLKRIGKPYDKTRWGMTPQTVNAYYSPNANEIVFPAAILQPPFFYQNADDAVNYGAIGVVIGHEMTHGFDDQGKNYDKNGNLNNWWTNVDSKAFDEKKQLLIEQFNNYIELDSLHVNGELTIGENIADLGGLNISWDAFQTTEQAHDTTKIEGFSPAQRFILSYSKVWRQSILPEELMRRLKEDVHAPGDARVNIPLFNLDFMYENFKISKNDKLYRSPENRAKIW
jgi:putative endopeptidase